MQRVIDGFLMEVYPYMRFGPEDGGNCEYEWKAKGLEAQFLTDVGRSRKHNEDACILCAPADIRLLDERGVLFAVADGMGGAKAGEFASRFVLHALVAKYYEGGLKPIPVLLRDAIALANAQLYEKANSDPNYEGMGTTTSAVIIHGDCLYIAHVGDSRVYIARDKPPIRQLTEDHSLVADQVRSGLISKEAARTHSLRNLITRAVGIKEEVEVDLLCMRLRVGDTVLICSDGLSGMMEDEEIATAMQLRSLKGVTRMLVGQALNYGGRDNITVVGIRVTETLAEKHFSHGAQSVDVKTSSFFRKIRSLFS